MSENKTQCKISENPEFLVMIVNAGVSCMFHPFSPQNDRNNSGGWGGGGGKDILDNHFSFPV